MILRILVIFPIGQNHRRRSHSCPSRQKIDTPNDKNLQMIYINNFKTIPVAYPMVHRQCDFSFRQEQFFPQTGLVPLSYLSMRTPSPLHRKS